MYQRKTSPTPHYFIHMKKEIKYEIKCDGVLIMHGSFKVVPYLPQPNPL